MHMSPTAPQERIQYLDVLRGIAILGMFAVNMTVDVQRPIPIHEMNLVFVDFLSVVLVDMFGNGKFIMIFSFLFGIDFYMQYERTKRLHTSFAYSYIRRAECIRLSGTFVEVSKSRLSHVWKAFSNWRYYLNNVGLLGYMICCSGFTWPSVVQ